MFFGIFCVRPQLSPSSPRCLPERFEVVADQPSSNIGPLWPGLCFFSLKKTTGKWLSARQHEPPCGLAGAIPPPAKMASSKPRRSFSPTSLAPVSFTCPNQSLPLLDVLLLPTTPPFIRDGGTTPQQKWDLPWSVVSQSPPPIGFSNSVWSQHCLNVTGRSWCRRV